MSNTRYARDRNLRMDAGEQRIVAELVMREIEDTSHALNGAGGGTQERQRYLRTLRSLLERLSS